MYAYSAYQCNVWVEATFTSILGLKRAVPVVVLRWTVVVMASMLCAIKVLKGQGYKPRTDLKTKIVFNREQYDSLYAQI